MNKMSIRNLIRKIFCLSLVITMIFSMTSNAFAKEIDTKEFNVFSKDEVMQLKPYIKVESGLYKFDSYKAIKDGYNSDMVEGQKLYLENLNNEAKLGNIFITSDLEIITKNNRSLQNMYRSCPGKSTGIKQYWWGYSRYANDCESKRIVSDLNTAAAAGTMAGGAAGMASLIFPGAAIVAGGAAFDAGYWWLVATRIDANNKGKGVYIEMTWALLFDITPQ